MLGEVARTALEQLMNQPIRYQSDFARKYYAEGLAEGEARGLAEGEARGEVRSLARMLLKQLRFKGLTVPVELQARVEACQDLAQLEQWAERVVGATSLADVFY